MYFGTDVRLKVQGPTPFIYMGSATTAIPIIKRHRDDVRDSALGINWVMHTIYPIYSTEQLHVAF